MQVPRLASWQFSGGLTSTFHWSELNSVLRANSNFGAYKNERRAAFYLNTEFLGCAECECFAGAVLHCNFALCVATKLTWVGACIPPGLASPTGEEAMQKLDLQLIVLYRVLLIFIYVTASLTPIQSLQDCKSSHSRRPTEHSLSQPH